MIDENLKELAAVAKHIAGADPPPVLHRYRRPTEWTIKELSAPEIYVAGVEDMNDPFELLAPFDIDKEKLAEGMYDHARRFLNCDHEAAIIEADKIDEACIKYFREGLVGQRALTGLICASANPRSNRMWAYYAEAHKGICIGYDTSQHPFFLAKSVSYGNPEKSFDLMQVLKDDSYQLKDLLSCRKATEWAFEEEYRIPIGPMPEDKTRLLPVSQGAIIEIRFGVNVDKEYRKQIIEVVCSYETPPRLYQMRCDRVNFTLVENEISL